MIDDAEITEIDRMAYIDGQLDEPRRLDIERRLSADPRQAADMMGQLSHRTALRMALTGTRIAPSPALDAITLATPTQQGRRWRPFIALAAMLTAALLIGVAASGGRLAHLIEGEPQYLDDAVQSRDASLVRTSMASRPRTPWMRPNDIRTAIRIRLPVLPPDWRLIDVQVYPSDEGPSAQLLIDAGDAGQLSLFSSRTTGDDTFQPVVVDREGETLAFWEIEGQSFVLIGDVSRTDLRDMAIDLADNRLL